MRDANIPPWREFQAAPVWNAYQRLVERLWETALSLVSSRRTLRFTQIRFKEAVCF